MPQNPVIEIHGAVGADVPLVFLHAYPLHRGMWRHQVKSLSRSRRVITLDLPGFGESTDLPEANAPDKIQEVTRLILDTLRGTGGNTFVWAGCSMGGYLIMEALRQAPETVTGMILCDTRADADSDETRQKRKDQQRRTRDEGATWLGEFVKENLLAPETVTNNAAWANTLAQDAANAKPETIIYYLDLLANRPDSWATLQGCHSPALILCGEHDKVTPAHLHEEMHSLLTRSTFQIVPAAGHLSPAENPEFVNQAISAFLEEAIEN